MSTAADQRFNETVAGFAELPAAEQYDLIRLHGISRVRWFELISNLNPTLTPAEVNVLRGSRGSR